MLNKWCVAIAVCVMATGAWASETSVVAFTDLHTRPSVNDVQAAYFTVTSTANDAIVGVRSGCCKAVELHRNEKINGMMSMRRIGGELALKKNTPLEAQPGAEGGMHLMLLGLKEPLVDGDEVVVTFTFKKAGEKMVSFPVKATSGAASTATEHGHH